jgi:hypothetical protein
MKDNNKYKSIACGGGLIHEAFAYLEKYGTIKTIPCSSYDWCKGQPTCNGTCLLGKKCSYEDLNELVPKCAPCMQDGDTVFKAVPNATHHIGSDSNAPDVIQSSLKTTIYNDGPVASGFMVYMDFVMGSKELWPSTQGIYIHGAYEYIDPSTKIQAFKVKVGGHAVQIVGWGTAHLDMYNDTIPYFWIKNTWSTRWGESGYCRIAMANTDKKINVQLGLDAPYYSQGGAITCIVP